MLQVLGSEVTVILMENAGSGDLLGIDLIGSQTRRSFLKHRVLMGLDPDCPS